MVQYRRSLLSGANYFFTIALLSQASSLLVDHIAILLNAFRIVRVQLPFMPDTAIILLQCAHCIGKLPKEDADYPRRWDAVKTRFSFQISHDEWCYTRRVSNKERGVGQTRCWEYTLRHEQDRIPHIGYIHFNQVKRGHVSRTVRWPCFSFHQFVYRGVSPIDWCGDAAVSGGGFRE